jgi:hypothetical protein
MSFITTTTTTTTTTAAAATISPKQRKLGDLRVADLQRELRTFGVAYDKKELKLSLVEKLRQVCYVTDYCSMMPIIFLGIDSSKLRS